MKRLHNTGLLILIMIGIFAAVPSLALSASDHCASQGILVKNLTMLDLWHKKNGGDCSILIHEHALIIKPDDTIKIFSDLTCKTRYCIDNPTYKDFKSVDTNGDCKVRILPDCTLSDM